MLTQINHFKLLANFQSASVAYRIETRDSVLANETVGKTTAEAIVRRVAKQEPFASNATLAGERIARILERAHGVSVDDIIARVQIDFCAQGKLDKAFCSLPYHDSVD
jgi:hypothetical protein